MPYPTFFRFTQVVIYIALKLRLWSLNPDGCFTQVVIYIALKRMTYAQNMVKGFTQVVIYIALKRPFQS